MSVACVSKNPRMRRAREFVLEHFAPYRIVALGHAISGRLSSAYRDENLTIPEWRVLAVVAQAKSVAARDVVRQTPMDKMTVSRAIASLEEKSYVVRAPDQQDRRVSAVSLTETGRALFDRVAALALDYEAELLGALSPDERTAFDNVIRKLEQHASKSGQ